MRSDTRGNPFFATLVERARSELREQILTGEWDPGSRLPIDLLASRLQMSPIPVREALRSLASEGLLVAIPQRGFRVADLNADDFIDLFRLRYTLDLMALEMAVPRLRGEHMVALEDELAALAEAHERGDWADQRDHHRRFHFLLFSAADSPWLVRLLNTLWDHSERYLQLSEQYRGRPEHVAGEHAVILAVCKARDTARARATMRVHLDLTRKTVLDMLASRANMPAAARHSRSPHA